MSKAHKLKEILKDGKPSFGTNPMDPWSAKAGLAESESGLLKKFLLSRGINPKYVSKDQKIAHSKSNQFANWRNAHLNIQTEDMTVEPTPVQKRSSDLATAKNKHAEVRTSVGTHDKLHKEDVKNEKKIEKKVDKIIKILKKEETEQIDELKKSTLASYVKGAMKDREERATAASFKSGAAGDKYNKADETEKEVKRSKGIDTALGKLAKEETVNEVSDKTLTSYLTKVDADSRKSKMDPTKRPAHKANKSVMGFSRAFNKLDSRKPDGSMSEGLADDFLSVAKKVNPNAKMRTGAQPKKEPVKVEPQQKSPSTGKTGLAANHGYGQGRYMGDSVEIDDEVFYEDAFQDSQAATPMPFDTGNNPAEVPNNPGMSKKTDKVMRIIKNRKVVKEDLYDHEKDDKTPQTTGKPKLVTQKDLAYGEGRPEAAVVMSGGKTMTGEPRDTIEIDPMMKKAKQGDVNTPSMDGSKPDNKKENK
jgi:hypothetical protein